MRVICSDETAATEKFADAGWLELFTEAASLCVEKECLNPDDCEVSLTFVTKDEIRQLNRDYRQIDNHTDVLSFPLIEDFDAIPQEEEILLGDVVICLEKAREQAEEYGHSLTRELVYLFVHSVCHLLGFDHMEEADQKEMRTREEEVMSLLHLERSGSV